MNARPKRKCPGHQTEAHAAKLSNLDNTPTSLPVKSASGGGSVSKWLKRSASRYLH